MTDEEVMAHINKYWEESQCLRCAIWNTAAQANGKSGMCGECFDMYCVPIESNIERLGMPWLLEWKNKEELPEMYPE